ncbi:MAG: hypothetical protein KDB27_05305, partial [Planctomycetales bacterium]|nr:hypothetical protein [Planctomycetales bacterium]
MPPLPYPQIQPANPILTRRVAHLRRVKEACRITLAGGILPINWQNVTSLRAVFGPHPKRYQARKRQSFKKG